MLIPCPVPIFGNGQLNDAKIWINESPQNEFTINIGRQRERTFLRATLHGALDREAVARLIQAAYEGISDAKAMRMLIEAEVFHGWRDLRALWQHIRFAAGRRATYGAHRDHW